MLERLGIAWVGRFAEDIERLGDFYGRVPGLALIEDDPSCRIFDARGGALFEIRGRGTVMAKKTPREPSMIIGWRVGRLEPAVVALGARGLSPDTLIDGDLGARWVCATDPGGKRFELEEERGAP